MNFYGQYSMIDGFNFKNIDRKGVYGYWDHMDYIIQKAEQNGIYIAMVCIWGGLEKDNKIKSLKEFGCNLNNYNPYEHSDQPEFRDERASWF